MRTFLFNTPLTYARFRHTPHPNGYQAAAKLSEEYATRSRSNIDIDEPCIDSVQALLLLVIAFTAIGKGKKAYMLMSTPSPSPWLAEHLES